MKLYIASYQDGRGDCWDIKVWAENWKEAAKDARGFQREYGKLWSVRRWAR